MYLNSIVEIVTIVAAFVGMALGFYNFYIERNRNRALLKVEPKAIMKHMINKETGQRSILTTINEFPHNPLDDYFCIEVTNMSVFPVFVSKVGFETTGTNKLMHIYPPITFDEGDCPRKLEPRESFTAYCKLDALLQEHGTPNIKSAFAETSCGAFYKGKTKALIEMVKYSRKLYKEGRSFT